MNHKQITAVLTSALDAQTRSTVDLTTPEARRDFAMALATNLLRGGHTLTTTSDAEESDAQENTWSADERMIEADMKELLESSSYAALAANYMRTFHNGGKPFEYPIDLNTMDEDTRELIDDIMCDITDGWHGGDSNGPIYEAFGWQLEDYSEWIRKPDFIPAPIKDFENQLEVLAIAAKAGQELKQ